MVGAASLETQLADQKEYLSPVNFHRADDAIHLVVFDSLKMARVLEPHDSLEIYAKQINTEEEALE